MEVQGEREDLEGFLHSLRNLTPAGARVEGLEVWEKDPVEEKGFAILESETEGDVLPTLPPDLAICPDCAQELEDHGARRFRYPFTNCTRCGPRYSIVESLPYDRGRTSMKVFELCRECAEEYSDPSDRRFHAEAIACPRCGPVLRWLSPDGRELACSEEALRAAVTALREGKIVALLGLGGFQLLVDATNARAVTELRRRKRREEKPFAVMFPSLSVLTTYAMVSEQEAALLESSEAPIVLLRRRSEPSGVPLAEAVAPGNPWVGAMLPYTPLHLLLSKEVARPVVCTSGNLSEEPMCTEVSEALVRLGDVADGFLVHDRRVVRPVDDSVVRLCEGSVLVLRRARGYAPRAHRLGREDTPAVLALGAHRKSTVALMVRGFVVVSQHLGDLESVEGLELLERTVNDLVDFYSVRPERIVCDLHPDYASSRYGERLAEKWGLPLVRVQHHHAHVAACMAEYGLRGPVLGLAWDGSGYGTDGTLWGGEVLICDGSKFRRVAHLRKFVLPGGERAVREPRRAALGVLYELAGREGARHVGAWFSPAEMEVLLTMLDRSVNTPRTSSVGRLFDAVAALVGVRGRCGFEGQAAMELEWAADRAADQEGYEIVHRAGAPAVGDWGPMVHALLEDRRRGVPPSVMGRRFHWALVQWAERVALEHGIENVVLSGGCFQNRVLTEMLETRLRARGFRVYCPREFPPHDGAIALGQAAVVSQRE